MEEENKQEVVNYEVEAQPKKNEMDEESKYSLITFIIACIGASIWGGWIVGGIASAVLGIIGLERCNGRELSRKQPYRTFDRISKPVSIANIVIGCLVAIGYTIKLVVDIVNKK